MQEGLVVGKTNMIGGKEFRMRRIRFTILMAGVFCILNIAAGAGLEGILYLKVVDSSRQPLEGVKISIVSENDQTREYTGFTDAEGTWSVTGIEPDTYDLKAELEGYLSLERHIKTRPGVKVKERFTMELPPEVKMRNYNENIRLRDASEKEPECIDSRQMKATVISSYPQREITPGSNLVYCSTFQLAWDLMRYDIIKEDIRLAGDPIAVHYLNTGLSKRSDVSEDFIVTVVDRVTPELKDRIERELKAKFNDEMPFIFDFPEQSESGVDEYYAFSAMFKNLQFAKVFESLKDPLGFHADSQYHRVRAFGISKYSNEFKDQGEQVSILDYRNDQDFIIELISTSPDDRIILAKIAPGATLSDTIETVRTRILDCVPGRMKDGETLRIPVIDFNVKHEFEDLIDRHLKNCGWESYFVGGASQWIRFRLNEKGAILKSMAELYIALGIDPKKPRIRSFIFNPPFLLLMQEKTGGYPYFAAWIANTELMFPEVSQGQ